MNDVKNNLCKLIVALILMICVCVSAASCGAKDDGVLSPYSAEQIAQVVINSQTGVPELFPLKPGDGLFSDYITAQYKLDTDDIADGIVFYAEGADATEIAVLLLKGTANVKKTADALNSYKERRVSTLTGYVPEQAEIAERGVVVTRGAYAALLICGDSGRAERDFISCFSSDPPKLPEKAAAPQEQPSGEASVTGAGSGDEPDEAPPASAADPGSEELQQDGSIDDNSRENAREDSSSDTAIGIADGDESTSDSGGQSSPADTEEDPERDGEPADGVEESTSPTNPSGAPTQSTEPSADPSASPSQTPSSSPSPSSSPAAEDKFDPSAILAAWNSGDASSLTEKNRKILESCADVIQSRISSGMSDYEKELVIHDWIVLWTDYDVEASNNSPMAKPDPDNDNPYGLFFSRKSICSGYSSTFQLFMDMLGVECITVRGHARNMDTEHAWNMVRLDGEWYCVDVTWDDPIGAPPNHLSHDFFNVTSQYMRDTRHIWNESSAPTATATAYSWTVMNGESGDRG